MGLDWKKIREDYQSRATEKELDGPFDEGGNLKGTVARKMNKEATETIQSKKRRNSQAQDPNNPIPPTESGGMRTGRRLSDDARRRILLAYETGATVRSIAKAEGYTPTTIINALKRAGAYNPGRDMGRRARS